jgi:HD-GYP domain-containing protein (c-di-GMP phosphodiesterase class II)
LKEILPAILYHHERMDGSGYPEGLAGDDIPLEARIIAVADSFDAMVAERPYKRALTVREATEELQSCAGTHFDRAVVDAFCAYIERITRRGNEDYSREAIRKGIAT